MKRRESIGMAVGKHFENPEDVEETTDYILNEIMMLEKEWRSI